jgi:hypothetical protein
MQPISRYHPERYRQTQKRQLENPLLFRPGRDILSALGRYGYLTANQVRRLLYAPTSGTFVSQWLKTLKEAGLAHDDNWLRINPTGQNPRVWTFTERGRRLLTEKGETELPSIHHKRILQPWVLDHTIAVNESLVTCELLARRSNGTIELLELRSDEMLHKIPIAIELAGKRSDLAPDGWVAYGFGDGKRSFCLEVDRGTEAVGQWRTKIRAYILALSGKPSPYEKTLGFVGTTVMVVIRPKEQVWNMTAQKRLSDLLAWTELELTELNKKAWAPVFRFTTLAPEETESRSFFGSASWHTPFEGAQSPLWGVIL